MREIAEHNGVSKSTVKAYALRHGIKPVDTSGNAYLYPEDLMEIIADKYAEPAHSAELFKQAENSAELTNLEKRVAQLTEYVGWWSELDDQRLVPLYIYRLMFNSKAVRTEPGTVKLMTYFGRFSLNPANDQLKLAVGNGAFNYFVRRLHHITKEPADGYALLSRWNKYSDKNKHIVIQLLDESLSKKFKSYHDFKTGSSSGSNQGAGGSPLAIEKAISATGSRESDATRCKNALLADKKNKEMEM